MVRQKKTAASASKKSTPDAQGVSSRSVAAVNKIDLASTDEYVFSGLRASRRAAAANTAVRLGVFEAAHE